MSISGLSIPERGMSIARVSIQRVWVSQQKKKKSVVFATTLTRLVTHTDDRFYRLYQNCLEITLSWHRDPYRRKSKLCKMQAVSDVS